MVSSKTCPRKLSARLAISNFIAKFHPPDITLREAPVSTESVIKWAVYSSKDGLFPKLLRSDNFSGLGTV